MRATALALFGVLALSTAPRPVLADAFEDAVLDEINHVRANPAAYARELRRQDVDYAYERQEDPDAVAEAIDVLRRQPSLAPLRRDPRIAAAAAAHAGSQGRRGGTGHGAAGSLGRRLQGQGVFAGLAAEAISYGQSSPRDVVRQLVVDSGVPTRGHRRDILSPVFQSAGVACGPHPAYGAMCVINFAGALARR